jgi:hypothetical protein
MMKRAEILIERRRIGQPSIEEVVDASNADATEEEKAAEIEKLKSAMMLQPDRILDDEILGLIKNDYDEWLTNYNKNKEEQKNAAPSSTRKSISSTPSESFIPSKPRLTTSVLCEVVRRFLLANDVR